MVEWRLETCVRYLSTHRALFIIHYCLDIWDLELKVYSKTSLKI